jgi:hypothetical protein
MMVIEKRNARLITSTHHQYLHHQFRYTAFRLLTSDFSLVAFIS